MLCSAWHDPHHPQHPLTSCHMELAISFLPPFRSCIHRGIEGEGTKMGNCQASEVAMVVIQHPGGKVERLYWPTSAADVMKSNPGYCVALVTHSVSEQKQDGGAAVRFTRVRLLKPKDMLLLGQVYRLITSQEVTQAVMQRKHDKLNKNQQQRDEEHRRNAQAVEAAREEQQEDSENKFQMTREDRDRRTSSTQTAAARGRHWRPSLQSISEAVS